MIYFLVTQQGVYTHDIIGIFDNEAAAVQAANETAKADGDNYHQYEVLPFTLNIRAEETPRAIYSVSLWGTADPSTCDHVFSGWGNCRKCGAEKK